MIERKALHVKHIPIIFLAIICLIVGACSTESAPNTSSGDSNTTSNTTSQKAVDYSFNVKIGDDPVITQNDAKIDLPYPPGIPADTLSPAFDIEKGIIFGFALRVELDDNELIIGESEIERMTARFDAEIDGEMQTLACGGNDGTPDDVFMTITEATETRLSGSLTITLTSCHDSATASSVDYESVTVVADFTNIPYRPEE